MRIRLLHVAFVAAVCLAAALPSEAFGKESRESRVAPVPGGVQPTPRDAQAAAAAGNQPDARRVRAGEAGHTAFHESYVTFRVFATQYQATTPGSVEVALPDKCVKFAARRDTFALRQHNCSADYALGLDYRVAVVRDNGATAAIPVREVGPWNTDDNYWNGLSGPRPRRRFTDLPRGVPEAQAAFNNGYNVVSNCLNLDGSPSNRAGGADQFGRCVLNPAGIDLSFDAARLIGLVPGQNEWVTVSFVWEPIRHRLVAHHSGKSMDVAGVSQTNGAQVIQYASHNLLNQQWRFDRLDNGNYRIVALHSGKVLDIAGGSLDSGATLHQWAWHGGANQQFRLERRPDGLLRIVAVHSGKSLDVAGFAQHDGAAVIQWPAHDGANQLWRDVASS